MDNKEPLSPFSSEMDCSFSPASETRMKNESSPEDALRFVAVSFAEAQFSKGIVSAFAALRISALNECDRFPSFLINHECVEKDESTRKRFDGIPSIRELVLLVEPVLSGNRDCNIAVECIETVRVLTLAIHRMENSSSLSDILAVLPILIELKRRILLGYFGYTDGPKPESLFVVWLDAVSAILGFLREESFLEKNRSLLIEYVVDRLVEVSVSTDSIRQLLLIHLDSENCAVLRAIFQFCSLLKESFCSGNSRIELFLDSFTSRSLTTPSLLLNDCPEASRCISKYLNLFGSHESFTAFRFSQFLLHFYSRNVDDQTLCVLLSALFPVPQSIKLDLIKFISREFGFKSVALRASMSRVPRESEKSKPASFRVPKLALPGLDSPMQNSQSSTESFFALKHLPLLRHKLVLLTAEIVYKGNKKTLDLDVVDQFPHLARKEPILIFLLDLVDWLRNQKSDGEILSISESLESSGYRVLRDLLFNEQNYSETELSFIGSGQFGNVHKSSRLTAIKFIRSPSSEFDRCTVHDSLNEAMCHSLCDKESFCVPLISCGRTKDGKAFFIETPLYSETLSQWRSSILQLDRVSIIRILVVFSEILSAIQFLHEDAGIIHYDLKMDNILVDYGTLDPKDHHLLIPKVGVTDFGEARIVHSDTEVPCMRNRGTECLKSPEMLSIASKIRKDGPNFDRRKMVGSTSASDIWSVGCLFFQLVTGEYLFDNDETDWLQFYYRVTGDGPILNERDRLLLCKNESLIEFTESLLVRDPERRPNIKATIRNFQRLYGTTIKSIHDMRIELPPAIPGVLKVIDIHKI